MSFNLDDANVGGQLKVGTGLCPSIGESLAKVNGTMFCEGPATFGSPLAFPFAYATVNISKCTNDDLKKPPITPGTLCTGINNPYSFAVDGSSAFLGTIDCNGSINAGANIIAQGEVMSRCGGHVLSAKKNFDIPHPTKEGYRLRHTCPEGPSNDVYYRGKLLNRTEIQLPDYWEELVDSTTITVNLTPIGAHQHIIVKRIADNKIYLQSNGGIPIHCYYHIFGTRTDGERLIPEYEGESPADYPGNNDEYSVSGYHYDVK